MINLKTRLRWWSLVVLFQPLVLSAETRSSVTLELGADDNNGANYYLSGRYAFDIGLLLKAGISESENTSPALLAGLPDIETRSESKFFGLQTDPSSLFSVGVEKRESDQVDRINIDSTVFTAEINTLDWNLFVSPESRNVTVETATGFNSVSFDSNGLTAGLSYYGWDPVYVSYNRATYDYPARLSNVNTRIRRFTLVFGVSTVNQVYALEDVRNSYEVGYFFDAASIALNHSKGRSEIDGSISTINTIYLSYDLDRNWSLGASAGQSSIDISSEKTTFGSVSLGYRW